LHHNHYNRFLREFAKENRKNMTKSEAWLWKSVLCRKQMKGYKFKRQRPIFDYIADFVCLELKLIIEVDGPIHYNKSAKENDKERDQVLAKLGFTTLRFTSNEVMQKTEFVIKEIEQWISNNT